ncbi:peptidase U32 family protein [Loigolactobacillus bifermentans]|uniref:Peptidase, U32 family small subunit n=1 Tax=Loigolactobacillus bifermentans DSM 20003 TaxID=1423726 RepID=A0A0R1GIC3_9LACO|nr:peptidase U32 family protein [Loigolactobacillus bifermentans]KRK33884.1 peptidase, U32 family small subunit [Loigolactobacillus bifermentans DSM 20003]QGG61487.1 U32 family peptidase [Loigolactobacillus bifermentans]
MNLITTVASVQQAEALLAAGVDTLYLGESEFGLRLPADIHQADLKTIVPMAHAAGKKVTVAVNAIFHNDRIEKVRAYLHVLADLKVDAVTIGDPGAIHVLQQEVPELAYIYDAEVVVTSAQQVNFWARHGATGAVIAREVPYGELVTMAPELTVPGEIQVYGATCIHQSGRPLLHNYFDFVKDHQDRADRQRGLFIAIPQHQNDHYSIYEDRNGTHIFANNDLNLMTKLDQLYQLGLTNWKLDGLFTDETQFVAIAKAFVAAKQALAAGTWTPALAAELSQQVVANQPVNRGLDTGFYEIDPSEVQ